MATDQLEKTQQDTITQPAAAQELAETTLPIEGMTCASCVRRVEKALGKLPGIEYAGVNLATEQATVRFNPALVGRDEMRGAVEHAGYGLRQTADAGRHGPPKGQTTGAQKATDPETERRDWERRDLLIKSAVSISVGLIIMAGMFLPLPISMEARFWAMFALATPVQFWAGWSFYRGAWMAARHLQANMNTLIAVGTSAAYLYSVFVTFFPGAVAVAGIAPDVYYDTSTIIIGLILMGRYLEARAKGQT